MPWGIGLAPKEARLEISITGRHTTVTGALRDYAQQKIGKLDRYFDGIQNIHVILSIEGGTQKAECVFHVVRGGTIVAEADADDLYAALDRLVEKMERRIKRYKDKLRGPRHKNYGKRDSGIFQALTPEERREADREIEGSA